jgi:hypothetical protein
LNQLIDNIGDFSLWPRRKEEEGDLRVPQTNQS